MSEKTDIVRQLMPRAVLKPLTSQAMESIIPKDNAKGFIRIDDFPFKVGRESRLKAGKGGFEILERIKNSKTPPNNDIYLVDTARYLNISREHFLISETASGFEIIDRGSACGTVVDGNVIGGKDKGGRGLLQDGDTITIGVEESPYRFQFIVLDSYL